jgi:hypothetical protein
MITTAIVVSGVVFGMLGYTLGFFLGADTHTAKPDPIRIRREDR